MSLRDGLEILGGCGGFYKFTCILFSVRPSGTHSFVARRKNGEKGVPKGSKAALWNLAFYTGDMMGDVRNPYEFAVMQFTRFRSVRRRAGGVRFVKPSTTFMQHAARLQTLLPPDSCVLRPDGDALASPEEVPLGYTALRRIRNTFRITSVVQTRQLVGCVELDFQPSLRTSAHTGVAIRIPLWYAQLICMTFRRTDCHTPTEVPLGEDGRHKVRPAWGQHEPLGN